MNAALLTFALVLAGAWLSSAAGWTFAALTERLTGAPRLRERAWLAALVLPALAGLFALSAPLVRAGPALIPAAPVVTWAGSSTPAAGAPAGLAIGALLARPEALIAAVLIVLISLAGLLWRLFRLARAARRMAGVVARATAVPAPAPADLPIRVSDEIDQPLLAGFRRSVILIPREIFEGCDADQLALIAAHERAHHRGRHNWRLVAEEALLGLFWLNPLMGLIRARLACATEEACDAVALAGAPQTVRETYARTLIHTLRLRAGPELKTAFTGAGRNTMRLKAILNPPRPANVAVIALVLSLGAGIAVGAQTLTAQAAAEAREAASTAREAAVMARTDADRAAQASGDQAVTATVAAVSARTAARTATRASAHAVARAVVASEDAAEAATAPTAVEATAAEAAAGAADTARAAAVESERAARVAAQVAVTSARIRVSAANAERAARQAARTIYLAERASADKPGQTYDLRQNPVTYLINGQPAPTGFHPNSLAPETIQRVEITKASKSKDKGGRDVINFVLKSAG